QNAAQGSEGQVVFPVQIIETFCLIPQVLYLIPEVHLQEILSHSIKEKAAIAGLLYCKSSRNFPKSS
ncbi:hypothetical protein, partial [Chryseobacterium koreense]|uniref:hypothetical protein n=1 Tax=Chryseobacterium koreense TaxID=232216 RepID=UPI0017C1EC1F